MSTTSPSPYKALLFDVFGTVVDWRRSIIAELTQFFGQRGIEKDWEQFALDWRALYQPAMERVRSGERGYVVLDTMHKENLMQLLPGYDLHDLSDDDIDHLNRVWHRLQPWADTLPGMYRLRKQFMLGTLSNGNIALLANMAKHSSIPWDAILGSEPAQGYKPEHKVYLKSAAMFGLTPEQCIMVAAHNEDLEVAAELGFATAYINRPDEYGVAQNKNLHAEQEWTFVCDSMTELATKLGV